MASPLVQFTAEFVTFLAAMAGLALALLRGRLVGRTASARALLGGGFVGLGVSAFMHGTELAPDLADVAVVGPRAGGLVLLAIGAVQWAAGPRSRIALWAGLVAIGAGLAVGLAGMEPADSIVLFVGAAIVGSALAGAGRRSIAARFAVSAAATLLLIVLVLSLALSTVLTRTLENSALDRLDSRAITESGLLQNARRNVAIHAGVAARDLTRDVGIRNLDQRALNDDPGAYEDVRTRIEQLSQGAFLGETYFAYLNRNTRVVALVQEDLPWLLLSGTQTVQEAFINRNVRASIVAQGGRVLAVAAVPLVSGAAGPEQKVVGTVVAVQVFDDAYLKLRADAERDIGLRILTAKETASQTESALSEPTLDEIRRDLLAEGEETVRFPRDGQFVAARAVETDDEGTKIAFVASTPATVVSDLRARLFQTLFVIAMGGTILSLLLAAFVGDRIGAGLRTLTSAAEAIQGGDLTVRAGIATEDEIGTLGAAFDSMASSIEDKTSALRDAADLEARLRNRLQAVVAGMGEALVAVDAGGRITDINRAALELFDVDVDDAEGAPVGSVVAGSTEDGDDLSTLLATPSERSWFAIGTVVQPDRSLVPVTLSVAPLRDADGRITGQVVVARDLRREREVERMKREFFSRTQHEMRTPLTAVKGYAHILASRELPPERVHQFAGEILANADQLLRIVKMVEFFAAAEAGRDLLQPRPVDLRDLLKDLAGDWGERLDGTHSLKSRRVSSRLPEVHADPEWLRRSLDELVDNARKFSPDGGVITIAASRTETGEVEISVADQGLGMPREQVEAVFTDFYQGDASDTRRFGGLGLGLSLVRRVAEDHGGSVRCESVEGMGSKFSILLPARPMEPPDEKVDRRRDRAPRRPRRRVQPQRTRTG